MADSAGQGEVGLSGVRVRIEGDDMQDPTSSLAIRAQPNKRIRKQQSTTSLASRTSRSKRLRPNISRNSSATSVTSRPSASRNNSTLSVKHLLNGPHDDVAVTSGDEADSVMEVPTSIVKSVISSGIVDETLNARPDWAVRHRIYLDSELLSTTTSTQRPGYHKFQDILLREQIEIRLHTSHSGHDAHFATRHATLRFWRNDGTLAEKWMDKDMGGEQEHEFAMENMNDWTILHLSMGGDSDGEKSSESEDQDVSMEQTDTDQIDDSAITDEDADADADNDTVLPTMDIISHYVSDYNDARNIASAPGINSDDEEEAEDDDASPNLPEQKQTITSDPRRPSLIRQNSTPVYHWVEERRRSLEHQLREFFHCATTTCANNGGTCFALTPTQHLPVRRKDLTDWSQQIAHAHRSIAATTLHLAAKLVDDRTLAEDRQLADEGRERDDEDDLGQVLVADPLLASLRPAGKDAEPADVEALD
ncbi:hypothetical protein K461DRAFT_277504 [Myriangium duriaei CBS 260.36]|uniref:Uncharacterized protein n=1 Tax=Myriangium duriaei CBS 260.36 TaxID=1168546 RepID=A0A9P4J8R2_9PEZI|nr:hypothetical protein K461DRAFT_277504 [Myriangium duriaei CBS 260.36]